MADQRTALEQQVMNDYGKYMSPSQNFAEGGLARGYTLGGFADASPEWMNKYTTTTQDVQRPMQDSSKQQRLDELTQRYYGDNTPLAKNYAEGSDGAVDLTDPEMQKYLTAQQPQVPVTQPNFAPIASGQTEPAGGGAVNAPAPMMLSANPELNALLSQYQMSTDYGPELKQARAARSAREADFNSAIDKLATTGDTGPTKAEMYWKLAAAFGTPGKTGAFGEGLTHAATSMAEHKAEERKAEVANKSLKMQALLKKQEYALESAKDTEKTLLSLQSEGMKDRREAMKAAIKDYIDSGKPLSEAGKIAKDKGLVPGTPEYTKEVDDQATLLVKKQMGQIDATLASANASLVNANAASAKAAREAIKLEPDERKSIRDDEDAIHAGKATLTNLDRAIALNDAAFTNTAADQATYKKLRQTNPNDPRVKATEELENLVGLNVVGSLKTTFGGNPTEGERNALNALGGLGSANREVRLKVLNRAKASLGEAIDYRDARIHKIETGGYRKKTEEK